MIDSTSSSFAFSNSFEISSAFAESAEERASWASTTESRSRSFIAYHLFNSDFTVEGTIASIFEIYSSTSFEKTAVGIKAFPDSAAFFAAAAASFTPVPLSALVSIIVQPSSA